jgi:hypothetical protein
MSNYRAEQAGRVEVTTQWLWDNPDTQAYIYDLEADNYGLDPWVTVVGVDALRDGSKIILETGRIGERLVDPDYIVFVKRERTFADL